MHKKASLNLSISAIVILILAITMLGLGLTFMRNIFGTATKEFQEVSGTIHKQMIDQMKEGNKEIDLSSLVYDIEPGETRQIYIGFKNNDNEEKEFTINGVNVNSLSGDPDNCGLDKATKKVIIEYKKVPTTILPGTTIVLPINIKTSSHANKDSCFYELLIDIGEIKLEYHENFDGPSTPSGSWDTVYPSTNVYDDDWSTYGRTESGSGDSWTRQGFLELVYTKPKYAIPTSKWQIKDGCKTTNLTIPDDCWNSNQDNLSFQVESYNYQYKTSLGTTRYRRVYWRCYDGISYIEINRCSGSSSDLRNVYEEAMWWDIREPDESIQLTVNIQ